MVSVTFLKASFKNYFDALIQAVNDRLDVLDSFDPADYLTTTEINSLLGTYVLKTRAIASGTGVLINGGASATLGTTVTVSLDFETQADAEAGTGTGKPMNSLRVAQAIAAQVQAFPIGTVGHYAGTTPPDGCLVRDGSAISRTTYSALFTEIGTTYGAGNGTTTFNLPDDRGVFDRGDDLGRGFDTGRVHGSYQTDAFGSHTHGLYISNVAGASRPVAFDAATIDAVATTTSAAGDSETRPKNRAYLPIIRAY